METTGMKTCDEVAVKKTEDGVTVKKADDGIATKKADDGIATKKVYDEVAVKKNKQNIIWLSIAFSFIYFGKKFIKLGVAFDIFKLSWDTCNEEFRFVAIGS